MEINELGKLIRHFDNKLNAFSQSLSEKDYELSKTKIIVNQKELKLRLTEIEDEESKDFLLALGILLKGLEDFVDIARLTSTPDWESDNKNIETVWIKLCDSTERLEFASQFIKVKILDFVFYNLNSLSEKFTEKFGNGLYVSAEIKSDLIICNICKSDSRGCMHIEKNIYHGKVCLYVPINPKLESISLVTSPKDPRCRAWPWNLQNENKIGMLVHSFTNIYSLEEEE